MFHPWRTLRALVDWELRWEQLPHGIWGHTSHEEKCIRLTLGMDQAERRSTLAHELEHVIRGPHAVSLRDEAEIDEAAARALVPLDALIDALHWAADDVQLAEHLWVDILTVQCRLRTLTDNETAEINRRLDEAERRYPAC